MSNLHETQPGHQINRYVAGELACKAYQKALSPDNLISAFRRTGIVPIHGGKICPVKVLPATIYPKTETENQPSDSKCGEQLLDNLKITTVKVSTKPKRKAPPNIIGNLSDSKYQEILQTTSCKKALKLSTPIPAPIPSTSTSNKKHTPNFSSSDDEMGITAVITVKKHNKYNSKGIQ